MTTSELDRNGSPATSQALGASSSEASPAECRPCNPLICRADDKGGQDGLNRRIDTSLQATGIFVESLADEKKDPLLLTAVVAARVHQPAGKPVETPGLVEIVGIVESVALEGAEERLDR